MSFYTTIEQYLPEMSRVRHEYNAYLQAKNITKSETEKLDDYLKLTVQSYKYDDSGYTFSKPDIASSVSSSPRSYLHYFNSIISHKLRFHKMQDKTSGFSPLIKEELYKIPKTEGCSREFGSYWFYKRFPDYEKVEDRKTENVVRYALNVKPNVGLFKKLDNLCLKHKAYYYKVADEKSYDTRADGIIIYAEKSQQKAMLADLAVLVAPYIRQDKYDMQGYQNLNNGIFIADEIKKEQITQLKYSILDKTERNIFEHPLADEFEQWEREDNITDNMKTDKLKYNLYRTLHNNEFDYAFSNAQFQIYKMLTQAYNATKSTRIPHSRTKQNS